MIAWTGRFDWVFLVVVITVFLSIEETDSFFLLYHKWVWEHPKLSLTKVFGIDCPSIRLSFWSIFKDSRYVISFSDVAVLVNTNYLMGCCDLMLMQA